LERNGGRVRRREKGVKHSTHERSRGRKGNIGKKGPGGNILKKFTIERDRGGVEGHD